jgi:signal transduction histidine kinase
MKHARTIRFRLTVLYGLMFLVTGAILLTIGYALVRHNLDARPNVRDALQRLGIKPPADAGSFGQRFLGPGGPADFRVIATVRAQLRADELHRLVIEYIAALGVMTMVSVAAGWLLTGRALRPLREISATARRVSGENLGERIALSGPADELKELADTFDGMLGRLDAAFASQRHFVANASHELRTPLAIMRTEIDVALADHDASAEELRAMGEAVRDTVDRNERLIESLLLLARSASALRLTEPVDLAALAGDCITDLRARAEEAHVTIRAELVPSVVQGDPALLERMIANLIDNAIRHNVPDGWIDVHTRRAGDMVEVAIVNGGRPIDEALAATLTEPFRRIDRTAGGFGLGLSIVRSVAEAHGGRADVTAPPSGGLSVLVSLPGLADSGEVSKETMRALTKS